MLCSNIDSTTSHWRGCDGLSDTMEIAWITFVTATTGLLSAVVRPIVSYVVAARQIRASAISNNRGWIEALRDSVAEYVGLLLTVALIKHVMEENGGKVVGGDRDLRQIVERIVLVKNRILLMTNPSEKADAKLCKLVEASYQSLTSSVPRSIVVVRREAEAITQAGRDVLRTQWARVNRGE
jgi:hypothetical protein